MVSRGWSGWDGAVWFGVGRGGGRTLGKGMLRLWGLHPARFWGYGGMFRASGLRRTGLPGFGLAVEGFWGCERLRVLVEGLGGLGAFGKGFGDVGMVSGLGALHKLFRASARGFGFPVHGVAVHKDTVAWHGMVWYGLCGLGWPGWEDLRQPAKALLAGQGQKSSRGLFCFRYPGYSTDGCCLSGGVEVCA